MPNSEEFRRPAAWYYEYADRAENRVRIDRRRVAAALSAKADRLESDQHFWAARARNPMTAGIGRQKAAA
jgi:type IV secretory pathway TraG/TraD family ATPase VirD4